MGKVWAVEPSPLCGRLPLPGYAALPDAREEAACISPEWQLAHKTLVPLREETEARSGKTCRGHYLAPDVVVVVVEMNRFLKR